MMLKNSTSSATKTAAASWEVDEQSYTCSSQTLFCFNLL
ncbi:unnamed protein product [Brassica rapa subsp. narinosa]